MVSLPWLRTYPMPLRTVTLTGRSPCVETVSRSSRPSEPAYSAETVSSPALTAKTRWPSRASPPWEWSEAPAPSPPVATVPAGCSVPSAYRSKTAMALPAAALVAS
jgi:hypothetical protein